MELMAICRGIETAKSMGLTQVQICSDSLIAIEAILDNFKIPWFAIGIVEEIRDLRDSFPCCSFMHHVRELNSCADFLAGLLSTPNEIQLDVHSLPDELISLVRDDAIGEIFYIM
ncbi:uncharacterized protein LOC122668265 [Telopea speciosissima]|uniref:uncharacterized protein LOC122668265 n=1 Tax=Telopea speciosissima TaxID=54955 RepID=UPI001CC35E55|nr:uncharacterized protein LOC122668265 [Telopea speciosissima]